VIYRVVVTARANAEAQAAIRWKSEDAPRAAARWFAGLEKAIAKLGELPGRHPIAEEETERMGISIRQMLYGRRRGVFRLLFSIEGETVVLHSIRHAARGPIEP
jgi:plasmid stabilization system protein ParE